MTRQRRNTDHLYHDACWQARMAAWHRYYGARLRDYSDPIELLERRRCAWCARWIEPTQEAAKR